MPEKSTLTVNTRKMHHQIVDALKKFINITHCNGADRCSLGVSNNDLVWVHRLQSETRSLQSCLDLAEASGCSRLYDSMCDAVDHLCEHADKSRPWSVFAVCYSSDNMSTRSAKECRMHLLSACVLKADLSVFVISVGSGVDSDELKSMAQEPLYHVHVGSPEMLEDALVWKVCFGATSNRSSPMDYALIFDSLVTENSTRCTQIEHVQSNSPVQAIASVIANSNTAQTSTVQPQRSVPVHSPKIAAYKAKPDTVTIKMREFHNKYLHPSDRQVFGEFALDNYPSISTSWEEEDIEFLVLVESEGRSIVGLLVMCPENANTVHIRLVVVDNKYRGHGFGTKMLTQVAAKYSDRKVTLNVDFEHPELLGFYCIKGYARLEDVSKEQRVIMLSLNHAGLLARIPLPP